MFITEAERIREILMETGAVSPLLNLGSSTGIYRRETKPHIERLLFAPLRDHGIHVDHCDLKPAEGVDISGDILRPAMREALRRRGYRSLLIANMLEHVRDRAAVAAACEEIVGPGGLILATVPSSFPFHADPIDTYYRPCPSRLAALFPNCEPLVTETVTGPTYAERISEEGLTVARALARTLSATLAAPVRPKTFLSRVHRWAWYARPYTVSVALLRVRGSSPSAARGAEAETRS